MNESSRDLAGLDRSHVHNLLMLYLAVAYGADRDFDAAEERAIQQLLASWIPEASTAFLAGMVRAALDLYRTGNALSTDGLARGLGAALPPALKLQVLMDMGRVARADGEQSAPEAAVIARVRALWES